MATNRKIEVMSDLLLKSLHNIVSIVIEYCPDIQNHKIYKVKASTSRENPERKIFIERSGMMSTAQSAANDKTETLELPLLI